VLLVEATKPAMLAREILTVQVTRCSRRRPRGTRSGSTRPTAAGFDLLLTDVVMPR